MTSKCYIDNVKINAQPGSNSSGDMSLKVSVANRSQVDIDASLEISILDDDGNLKKQLTADATKIAASKESCFELTGNVEDVANWSPESPNLYLAQIKLLVSDDVLDLQEIRFGFRKIEKDSCKLLLNGEPIFLKGFNRHEDSPVRGMCTDMQITKSDLLEMKKIGCNWVRLAHYPHHPAEIELCDEMGLLVMCEIPLYWWAGYNDGEENYQSKIEFGKRQLSRLVDRDYNHPSVMFWSVSNETHEHLPEVVDGNRVLIEHVKSLDSTRMVVHVADHWGPQFSREFHFDPDDVICLNGYPTYDSDYWKINGKTVSWSDVLGDIHEAYPDKPILISEFGHPSLEGVFDNKIGEDTQAAAIEDEYNQFSGSYICGVTVWCYADHPWPELNLIGNITMSPYGVVTRDRKKLVAYHVIKKLFSQPRSL